MQRTEEAPYPAKRMMTILVSLYAVAFLDRNIIAIIAPALQADLQLTATELSLLQGLGFAIFYAVLGLPLGALVDRMSRRVIIFWGVVIWSISASAGSLATGFWQLLLSRFGVGAGEAALSPSAYSMIADGVPRPKLGLMSTIFASGSAIGAAISVAGGGALMGWATAKGPMTLPLLGTLQPWQFVLLCCGLPGLLLAPAIFLIREPPRGDRIKDSEAGIDHLLRFMRDRRSFFVTTYGAFAVWQALTYSSALWVPSRFVNEFGWSYADVGIFLALAMLSAPVGGLVTGKITSVLMARGHITAPLTVSAVGTAITGAFLVAAFTTDSVTLFTTFLIIAYFPTVLVGLGATSVQMISPNEYRGRLIALYTFVITLAGAALGPLFPALLVDYVFEDPSKIVISVAIVAGVTAPLAALLMLAARGPMKRAYDAAAVWRDVAA